MQRVEIRDGSDNFSEPVRVRYSYGMTDHRNARAIVGFLLVSVIVDLPGEEVAPVGVESHKEYWPVYERKPTKIPKYL